MISIFISRKHEDAHHGKKLHDFLQEQGIACFDSEITLKQMGNGNFREVIDEVLDQTEHMVLIASKLENLKSKWVKAEWDAFENELRSDRKKGNLILLISKKMELSSLPLALRQKQIFYIEDRPYHQMMPYLGRLDYVFDSKGEVKNKVYNRYLTYGFITLLISIISIMTLTKLSKTTPKLNVTESLSIEYSAEDFQKLKVDFLTNGLDKTVVMDQLKKMTFQDLQWGYEGAELFQEKAVLTPFMKDTYIKLSEDLINYTDSLRNAK